MQTITTQYAATSEIHPQKIPILLTDIHPFSWQYPPQYRMSDCYSGAFALEISCPTNMQLRPNHTEDALRRENNSDVRMKWKWRWTIWFKNGAKQVVHQWNEYLTDLAIMWKNKGYIHYSLFIQTCVQVIHTGVAHPWKLFTVYILHNQQYKIFEQTV